MNVHPPLRLDYIAMWLILGFAALGLLLGNLVGMTSESIVGQLVGLLFVFVGGSVFALLQKLNNDDRALSGKLLMSISLATLVGVYGGIAVNEFRLLSPSTVALFDKSGSNKYVRSAPLQRSAGIDVKRASGLLTAEEAYAQMYELAASYEKASGQSK
jgi:hypothetical protein